MTRGSRVQLGVLLILQTVMALDLVLLLVLWIGWQFGSDRLVPDAVRDAVSGYRRPTGAAPTGGAAIPVPGP